MPFAQEAVLICKICERHPLTDGATHAAFVRVIT
jgi:hypothetical protein